VVSDWTLISDGTPFSNRVSDGTSVSDGTKSKMAMNEPDCCVRWFIVIICLVSIGEN